MPFIKKSLNLLGQIRLYSLVDLVLILVAIRANTNQFIGVLALHLSFILFLEESHKHSYRESFPKYSWLILMLIGLYFQHTPPAFGFLILSFLYVKKKNTFLGRISPIVRGLQTGFLGATVVELNSPLFFLVIILMTLRNFAGDLRDIEKDKQEGLKTLPMLFGFKKSYKNIHLIALLTTSLIWCFAGNIALIWLIIAYIIEILTYNLTPR